MLRLPLPHHGLSPDLRLHWRISTSVRSANLLANLRIVTDEQLEKCITSGRHQPTLGAQRRLDGVNWSSRYRHLGTCVMRQPVRPSAVAPHKTGPRLRVRPSAKVVGATRSVSIMREVVVHQHAAHRHAMRHRTVIEVDDIPAHGVSQGSLPFRPRKNKPTKFPILFAGGTNAAINRIAAIDYAVGPL